MRRREWLSLGQAIKDLRKARDLRQKQVVTGSGEEMGERALRSYESGEQRPSRDRLLRLLINSLALSGVVEVDRFLELGRYAHLTNSEILQYGLKSAVVKPDGRPSTDRPGAPADFRIEVRTLVVTDGQGEEVWRHQFATRFAQGAYERQDAVRRCAFADIDGDGGVETLFVYMPLDFGSVGATLICFTGDGNIKWQFVPGKTIKDTSGREYSPPYFISNVQVIPIPSSNPRILVSSNHYLHNPNQIAMLDVNGHMISEYWHSGHLLSVFQADLDGDGIEEILLGGVNNGYRQATMVVFDPRDVCGASSQPGRQILGFDPGTEKAIVLFPRTCLAKTAPYTRVVALWVTKERRIVVVVAEGVSEAKNPGLMIYELDFRLKVISARPDSHFQESHRVMESEGLLDHAWREAETEELRRRVVVKSGL